jgi:hypothetical protein
MREMMGIAAFHPSYALSKSTHHQDMRSAIDGGHGADAPLSTLRFRIDAKRYVECAARGVSAYLCASQDDSIAGTRPTRP